MKKVLFIIIVTSLVHMNSVKAQFFLLGEIRYQFNKIEEPKLKSQFPFGYNIGYRIEYVSNADDYIDLGIRSNIILLNKDNYSGKIYKNLVPITLSFSYGFDFGLGLGCDVGASVLELEQDGNKKLEWKPTFGARIFHSKWNFIDFRYDHYSYFDAWSIGLVLNFVDFWKI